MHQNFVCPGEPTHATGAFFFFFLNKVYTLSGPEARHLILINGNMYHLQPTIDAGCIILYKPRKD